jgi:hypothetical protein
MASAHNVISVNQDCDGQTPLKIKRVSPSIVSNGAIWRTVVATQGQEFGEAQIGRTCLKIHHEIR